MKINFFTNNSPVNKIDKDLTDLGEMDGTLRDNSSIIDPVIDIATPTFDIFHCNYIGVPIWNRRYFVNNITCVRQNLYRLECHVDVLESFGAELKECECVVNRQQGSYNLYLDDSLIRAQANNKITTINFPSGFDTYEFVLAVAGN